MKRIFNKEEKKKMNEQIRYSGCTITDYDRFKKSKSANFWTSVVLILIIVGLGIIAGIAITQQNYMKMCMVQNIKSTCVTAAKMIWTYVIV